MFVAFLPFPTSLLGEYGSQQLVVVIYAGSVAITVAITRLMLSAAWWYAYDKPHLIRSSMDLVTARAFHIRVLYLPLVFLLSIAISFFSVDAAVYLGCCCSSATR
jgi:uncharacterized membrane protein